MPSPDAHPRRGGRGRRTRAVRARVPAGRPGVPRGPVAGDPPRPGRRRPRRVRRVLPVRRPAGEGGRRAGCRSGRSRRGGATTRPSSTTSTRPPGRSSGWPCGRWSPSTTPGPRARNWMGTRPTSSPCSG